MQIEITCRLMVMKDGSVRIRHEGGITPELFGVPAKIVPADAVTVCQQLAPWIKERFKAEFDKALEETK